MSAELVNKKLVAQPKSVADRPSLPEPAPDLELLRKDADLIIPKSNGEVLYQGTTRIEVKDEKAVALLPNDPRRDWREEMLEVAKFVNDLRREVYGDLVERHPELTEEYHLPKDKDAEIEPAAIAWGLDSLAKKGTDPGPIDPQVATQLKNGNKLLRQLIAERNDTPVAIRSAVARRSEKLRKALRVLEKEGDLHVNIDTASYMSVGGVMGRAILLAEGLANALPNVNVHIGRKEVEGADVPFHTGHKSNIVFGELEPPGETPRLQIQAQGGNWEPLTAHGVSNHFVPLRMNFATEVVDQRYLNQPANSDLCDPHGTLILNGEFRERKAARDTWSSERLKEQREDWRERNLLKEQNEALMKVAEKDGWHPDSAILSIGYVQRAAPAIDELRKLADSMRNGEVELPFTENGEQIVIHCRIGVLDYKYDLDELTKYGIRVIDPDGDVFEPSPDNAVPITIIHHERIDNKEMKTFFSELSGCATRTSDGSKYLEFPCFITGNASWLEAVSAGCITLHDGNDAGEGHKPAQLTRCMFRHDAIQNPDEQRGFSVRHVELKAAADEHLLDRDHVHLYQDLEGWTEQSRAFSNSFFQQNSIDDLLIGWAKAIEAAKGVEISHEERLSLESELGEEIFRTWSPSFGHGEFTLPPSIDEKTRSLILANVEKAGWSVELKDFDSNVYRLSKSEMAPNAERDRAPGIAGVTMVPTQEEVETFYNPGRDREDAQKFADHLLQSVKRDNDWKEKPTEPVTVDAYWVPHTRPVVKEAVLAALQSAGWDVRKELYYYHILPSGKQVEINDPHSVVKTPEELLKE